MRAPFEGALRGTKDGKTTLHLYAVRFDGAIELVQKIPWRTTKELLKRI